MSKVKAAGIYARISSDQEGTQAGVKRQVADCHKLADSLGWPVAQEYVDNDISAYSGRTRPQYERMLADIAGGIIDAVLVYHLDRLTRRPKELEHFVEVTDAAKVTQVRFVIGGMDIGTGDGLLVARIEAAVAANASSAASRRIIRKNEEVAQEGRPHGGTRAFGYENDKITICTAEANIIKKIVTRFLAGESLRSLAQWLNDNGVTGVRGKAAWRSHTVKAIISSPRIAGLREYRGSVVGDAVWKAIITTAEHDQVVARLDALKNSGRRAPRRYLLSGLLRCGKCGRALYSSNRIYSTARKEVRRYVCLSGPNHGGCGGLTVVAPPTEQLIADAVLYRLDTSELADALAGKASQNADFGPLAEEITADKAQLDELTDLYTARSITSAEWLRARNTIEPRIRTNEKKLAQMTSHHELTAVIGQGGALRRKWPDLTLDRQSAVVRAILDHAIVAPGTSGARSLDPSRITPVWRL